jgi:hypothetical protein
MIYFERRMALHFPIVHGYRTRDGGRPVKKIIYLAIFLLLIYGGYQYVRAYLQFNKLCGRIDLIVSEPQSHSPDSIVRFILAEAAKLEIPLSEEEVEVTIEKTDRASLGQALVERPGIDVESKILAIRFHYPAEIVGITKTFTYDTEKVFTSKASLADRYKDME